MCPSNSDPTSQLGYTVVDIRGPKGQIKGIACLGPHEERSLEGSMVDVLNEAYEA